MSTPILPTTPFDAGSSEFLEELYERFLVDPQAVSDDWRRTFAAFKGSDSPERNVIADEVRRLFEKPETRKTGIRGTDAQATFAKQIAVMRLMQAHRGLGHFRARLDPIKLRSQPMIPDLDPQFHGLTEADMDTVFHTGNLGGRTEMTLREIVAIMRETYTEAVGAEFLHIADVEEKRWLQSRLEATRAKPNFNRDDKIRFLARLIAAEGLEQYLHTAYVGQKRFSLEGGETTITALDTLIQLAGTHGVEEIVIGMAHRGRLNVLVNVMGKSPQELFEEFEGKHHWQDGVSGDVKYHQGHSSDVGTPGGIVHLALGFNPSHLEIIDPVTAGSVRGRQERRGDTTKEKVMAVLIHGDAAFAGQGVVYETLNLSQTRGYSTGGTLHIVVNNRIGFTTSHPLDVRSMLYPTDVAKVVQAPIFHVNGDDPEAVAYVTQLALEYRRTFKKDVLIDIICYRRHGHNEADEPAATQPMMYKKVRGRPTVAKVYAKRLEDAGEITAGEAAALTEEYLSALKAGQQVAPRMVCPLTGRKPQNFSVFRKTKWDVPHETGVPMPEIRRLGARLDDLPSGFELHPRVQKIVEDRRMMTAGAMPVDWGFAENMAYASLVEQGYPVRLSGQDSGRGTFFHRHAVLINQRNGDEFIPLQHLSETQAKFTVINSILSEMAVLGFEYGFAAASPGSLVIWEAQFGDFANGAQVVIDQFVVAAEQKWRLLCGLVLMLPHGYEGQGPEHTSARLERFMQMAAQENIQVVYPSCPAQMFHLLRRQMIRPYRKPLIIMSPKSLLRRKVTFSSVSELTQGCFQVVMGEIDDLPAKDVDRVVLCTGKVYWDILEARRERAVKNVAIVRVEQLSPYPAEAIARELAKYPHTKDVVWAQEEPENQGAWFFVRDNLRQILTKKQTLIYSGRQPMAAPSGGDYHRHLMRQRSLVEGALGLPQDPNLPISHGTR